MLFEKKKDERKERSKQHSSWKQRFYKFIFFTGLAIMFKGLKGWLRSKKRDMRL